MKRASGDVDNLSGDAIVDHGPNFIDPNTDPYSDTANAHQDEPNEESNDEGNVCRVSPGLDFFLFSFKTESIDPVKRRPSRIECPFIACVSN